MSAKFEALISGIHKLVHNGELTKEGLVAIGPLLGVSRGRTEDGVYGELMENESVYFPRVHNALRSSQGLAQMEAFYEASSAEDHRTLGRAINGNRVKNPQPLDHHHG